MKLWQRLYLVIWLSFFACLPLHRWIDSVVVVGVHALLGVALLIVTQLNKRELHRKPEAPDRLRRIADATANLAVAQAVLGVALGALTHVHLPSWLPHVVAGFHLALGLTILAQSSSTATGYDMWEEKETGTATARSS